MKTGETVAPVCLANHFAIGTARNEWKKRGLSQSHVCIEEVIVMSTSKRYTLTCWVMV